VKIVECPRDAWQGLPAIIPSDIKAAYLGKLIAAGFEHIDAISFVSPAAVPQMADAERVLEILDPPDHVEIIAIVVNEKGTERAIHTRKVGTIGFPYSVSPEFLRRNQHQTQQEALAVLKAIVARAGAESLNVVAYLSMAFGNPYGDEWNANSVAEACGRLIDTGVRQISLADTVGLASPEQIVQIVGTATAAHRGVEFGVHLHARRPEAGKHIRAAYRAGCRRFDSAIGGLGGCPFAQDSLVGNIPTETLLSVLEEEGAAVPTLAELDELIGASAKIARR